MILADQRCRARMVERLVVAGLRLRRRREDRLRQSLRLPQPLGQSLAADLAALPIALPARPGEVPADDALDREHLEPSALGGAPVGAKVEQVVGDDVARPGEPEAGEAREDAALVGDLGRKHDVEHGDSVAGDEEQPVVVEREQLAYLPAGDVNSHSCRSRPD